MMVEEHEYGAMLTCAMKSLRDIVHEVRTRRENRENSYMSQNSFKNELLNA
jgi:hypothetical protein